MKNNNFKNISYLVIETNSTCNLKCLSCNRELLKEAGLRYDKYLTVEEFDKRLAKFSNCSIDTIKLEGISEPMLHPEFAKMCETLNQHFPKAYKIIATNCQYNMEKSPFLGCLEFVDQVYLSIDGTEELYEKLRKGASWKKLIRFFEQLESKVSKTVREEKLFINFTLTNENYKSLDKMYELKEKYSLAGVRINLAQNWTEGEGNPHVFGHELIENLKKYTDDLKGIPDWKYSDCFWPYEGIVVDVFGDVRQCLLNTSQKPIFNIDTDDIEGYYNEGQHYKKIRSCLSDNKASAECENCDYKFLSPILKEIFGENQTRNSPRTFRRE